MRKIPILIVGGRKENLLTLESLLDSADLHLVRAETGHEALAKILDHDFALILMDVQMSGMDGNETAELMRANVRSRSIPIIFVTAARMDSEYISKRCDWGTVDYLFSPLGPQLLNGKVKIFKRLYRQRQLLEEKTRDLDAKVLELEVLYKELEEKNEKLELFSSLDGLTGLFNRRYFDDNLIKEWKQASRDNTQLSLLIVDIDFFKTYNDYYGPLEGDDCLRKVAQSLYESLMRPTDIIARYGGEEFTVILPNTGGDGAERVGRRMLDYVARLGIIHEGSSVAETVTVSIGASSVFPTGQLLVTSLLDRAGEALSEAKERGRNVFQHRAGDE